MQIPSSSSLPSVFPSLFPLHSGDIGIPNPIGDASHSFHRVRPQAMILAVGGGRRGAFNDISDNYVSYDDKTFICSPKVSMVNTFTSPWSSSIVVAFL